MLRKEIGKRKKARSYQNSNITPLAKRYTPTFGWSDNSSPPEVDNIEASYSIFAGLCFLTMRYNITELGNPNERSFLSISLPEKITPLIKSVSMISLYQDNYMNTHLMGVRIEDTVKIVNGVGGSYSENLIKKGYQGFTVLFPLK